MRSIIPLLALTMLSYALEDRPPLPVLKALLPAVFLLIALVLPPHPFRSYVFLPSIALLSLQTPLRYTTGSPGGDFGLGTGIYLLFLALDRLENGTEMLRDGYEAGEHEPIPVETFERIGYAFKLVRPLPRRTAPVLMVVGQCASMRGAGWNWRVKGTPIETSSRGSFILDRVLRVSFAYLAIDSLSTYCRSTLYFTQQVPLGDVKGLDLVLHLLAAGSLGAAAITLLYHSVCLLGVLTFVYSPAECPLLFGSLASASTLRSFWGKTWYVNSCCRMEADRPLGTNRSVARLRVWPSVSPPKLVYNPSRRCTTLSFSPPPLSAPPSSMRSPSTR